MLCFRDRRSTRQAANEYATTSDFQTIFSEDMAGLHLLAYLLTADRERAEQVFVAGLEDSINGNLVFKQWARSWSQRAIIKRAIRAVAPSPNVPPEHMPSFDPQTGKPEVDQLVRAVAALATFQRFVFVLSVLEGYSITESAALLACTAGDVIAARAEALKHIAHHAQFEPSLPQVAHPTWKSLFSSARAS
jgi:DNA-directed RNA polymerase specialized sigma24 family protein